MSRTIEGIYEDISTLLAELEDVELQSKFNLVAAPILCRYYTIGATAHEFISAIQASSVDCEINLLGVKLNNLRAAKFTLKGAAATSSENCLCGGRLELKYDYTHMVCVACGCMYPVLNTTVREDNSGVDLTPKRVAHSPTKHYEHWAQRIQGIESKEFSREQISVIRAVMIRDKIAPRSLTNEIMREILKDKSVKLTTELNEHTTKLVCLLGGAPPYILTSAESQTAREMFNTIMYYYEKQHPNGGNRPYYPYFIYRIYQHMFRGIPAKLSILRFIHLQGEDTVREHDNDLRRICEEAGENLSLKYTATIRIK